jgi:hypothetical protein
MKTQSKLHRLFFLGFLFVFLTFGIKSAAAQPSAPVPINPSGGSTITIPTFSWQASAGADYYEVELGPQSNPLTVYWSGTTRNLTLTPNSALKFTNEALYWRVRAYDSNNAAGPWSNKINFTKHIPAPVLTGPAKGDPIIEPDLAWQAVQGAAYYKVELSTSPTFYTLDHTYTTYNPQIIPASAIDHNTPWYWRVSGVDAENHVGTPSSGWTFDKNTPAPTLVSPANGSTITEPVLAWQAVQGAARYYVELSTSDTFLPLYKAYYTYNTQITPAAAIALNTYYWRVSGVDAGNNVGAPSTAWTFIKNIPVPTLVSPADSSPITEPVLEWQAVQGAASYKIELSTSDTFASVYKTYYTYNTQITPAAAIALNTYYWRVRGVDAEDHEGAASTARTFTLNAPPVGDPGPVLQTPINGETITTDPTFSWTRMAGATDYHLIVSKEPDFSPSYDYVYTDYPSFTPYTYGTSGLQDAYPNGTYYWKVEARNSGHTVIATSGVRSFTKQMTLPLISPADGATLTTDPTFEWTQVIGALDYHLVVSKEADFSPSYDYIYTDYPTYTPYEAGQQDAYADGTYFWKVEARNDDGTVIVTSGAWTFTIGENYVYLPLLSR